MLLLLMITMKLLMFNSLRHKRQERANDDGGFSGGEPAEV